jgi:hypothetical protein
MSFVSAHWRKPPPQFLVDFLYTPFLKEQLCEYRQTAQYRFHHV